MRGVEPGNLTLDLAILSASEMDTSFRLLMYLLGAGRGGRVYCSSLSAGTAFVGLDRTPRRTFHETHTRWYLE